ncbi:MAG TPA: hypothetical protein VGP23_05020 [Candidatus Binataceae bacterium]|jgi:hypothetical protein|nr:hypothetical protein [Candidatus Binataceae bacterium]
MGNVPKTFSEMLGEALREIAVLVIVFAPLDRWVEGRIYSWQDVWHTLLISAILFLLGVFLEKIRAVG